MDRSLGLPPIVVDGAPVRPTRSAWPTPTAIRCGRGSTATGATTPTGSSASSRYADLEDAHLLGSAYWVWKQACGDPQGGINDMTDALMREDCTTGEPAPPRDELLEILGRAYPRSAPGVLTALAADGRDSSSSPAPRRSAAAGSRCGSRAPPSPTSTPTGITNLEATAVPGGWIVTGCADGDYTLATAR